MLSVTFFALLSLASTLVLAVPVPVASPNPFPIPIFGLGDNDPATGTPEPVSDAVVASSLTRPADFSRIAYCSSAAVQSWTCGPPCAAVPGVEVLQTGGNSGSVPLYFIAHDPTSQSIVVAHQGTDPSNILSVLNDVEFGLTDLNTTLFPQGGDGVQVHSGFQDTFARTSDGILAGVQAALVSKGVSKVAVTGHSLGAAIATMDAVMLKQQLDPSISVSAAVFGLPRGGNQAWADLVDSNLGSSYTYVTNQNDPVPLLPPRLLGFQHPSGEIHINAVDANGDATNIVSCPGQDNENCSEGNSPLHADVQNHLGPYFEDISFGAAACPL